MNGAQREASRSGPAPNTEDLDVVLSRFQDWTKASRVKQSAHYGSSSGGSSSVSRRAGEAREVSYEQALRASSYRRPADLAELDPVLAPAAAPLSGVDKRTMKAPPRTEAGPLEEHLPENKTFENRWPEVRFAQVAEASTPEAAAVSIEAIAFGPPCAPAHAKAGRPRSARTAASAEAKSQPPAATGRPARTKHRKSGFEAEQSKQAYSGKTSPGPEGMQAGSGEVDAQTACKPAREGHVTKRRATGGRIKAASAGTGAGPASKSSQARSSRPKPQPEPMEALPPTPPEPVATVAMAKPTWPQPPALLLPASLLKEEQVRPTFQEVLEGAAGLDASKPAACLKLERGAVDSITLSISEEEKARLEASAAKANLSVSAYLRECALGGEQARIETRSSQMNLSVSIDLRQCAMGVDELRDQVEMAISKVYDHAHNSLAIAPLPGLSAIPGILGRFANHCVLRLRGRSGSNGITQARKI